MKVKELIELLQKHNPDTKVLIASDEEGNSFNELGAWGDGLAVPEGYRYDFQSSENIAEDPEGDYAYYVEEGEPVIVLWP